MLLAIVSRVTARKMIYSVLQSVRIMSGSNPISYSLGKEGPLQRVEWPRRGADRQSVGKTEVKSVWNYTSTLPYGFITCH